MRCKIMSLIFILFVAQGCDSRYGEKNFSDTRPFDGVIVGIELIGSGNDGRNGFIYKIRYGAEGFAEVIIENKPANWFNGRGLELGKNVRFPDSFK